jgi:hypothetical protein
VIIDIFRSRFVYVILSNRHYNSHSRMKATKIKGDKGKKKMGKLP